MSDRPEDVIDVALRVASALESVGARYFVGGSLASSLDGHPRATNDIDVVIDISIGKLGAFTSALGPDFEVDSETLRDAVLHGRCANIFYLPQVLKIDIFGHAHGAFDDSEFSRCRPVTVREGVQLVVKAPEDTVLRKLLWYRDGGQVSDRQWNDILGVLRAQGSSLDLGYTRRWATALAVGDLLDRATEEIAREAE